MDVSVVAHATDEIVDALARLLPQLSASAVPPSRADVEEMVASPVTSLLVARLDGAIVGTATVAVFRIPTGLRSWIDDVVVDEAVRGRGVGAALTLAALDVARSRGAASVELTSHGSRAAANELYRRLGFVARETNVYRYVF